MQDYYTSNASLGTTATQSDIAVLTAQAGVNARPFKVLSGDLAISAGYRYQAFGYGILSDTQNHLLAGGGGRVADLDFQTHTGFLNAEWTHGGWEAGAGIRYTDYVATSSGDSTYAEWVPSLHGGYKFTLSERDFLTFDADAAYRFSHTYLRRLSAESSGTISTIARISG